MAHRTKTLLVTTIVVLFLLIFAVTAVAVWRWRNDSDTDGNDTDNDWSPLNNFFSFTAWSDNVTLSITPKVRQDQNVTVPLALAVGISTEGLNVTNLWSSHDLVQMTWPDGRSLDISKSVDDPLLTCLLISWTTPDTTKESGTDCMEAATSHWYGGFEKFPQYWPMDNLSVPTSPLVTGDAYSEKEIGGVLEPMFLSSLGIGLFVSENSSSYISFKQEFPGYLCLTGKIGPSTPFFDNEQEDRLSYHVCRSTDVTRLWQEMSRVFISKPADIPSPDLFRYPIWSTWAMYKAYINQTTTLQYANDIQKYGFGISQLEIDDNWTPKYGDFTFDPKKFPDAKSMISKLTSQNIPVTVWIHPFFNNDSDSFLELSRAGYLIKRADDDTPALTSWWRSKHAGILDATNPQAVGWYLRKTADLKSLYNVTSFKFDAGEVNWLPHRYSVQNKMATPNIYTKLFAGMASMADTTERRQETRVGFKTQNLPILVRMIDRISIWGHNGGLKSLIPTALTFSILGYPFILPDMIGGNAYDLADIDKTILPDPELFIRWLQVTTFMPTIQFSIAPWLYNDTILNISRKFVTKHEALADTIISLAKNAVASGEPIVRPVWWIAPDDSTALTLDSEFLLGENILIAPVLDPGQSSRDVYLPKGHWRTDGGGEVYEGPIWLWSFSAPLDVLPFFHKL